MMESPPASLRLLQPVRPRVTCAGAACVEKNRVGSRFLGTHTWQHDVLRVAVDDLQRVDDAPLPQGGALLDAGCGSGESFRQLRKASAPRRSTGLDADPHYLARRPVRLRKSAAEYLDILRRQGFAFEPRRMSFSYPWWCRAADFGLLECQGLRAPPGRRGERPIDGAARMPHGR